MATSKSEMYWALTESGIPHKKKLHGDLQAVGNVASLFESTEHVLKTFFIGDEAKNYYCISTLKKSSLDMKKLEEELATSGCRFGGERDIQDLLKINSEELSPLAAINDYENIVVFAFDTSLKALDSKEVVWMHLFRDSRSVGLTVQNLEKYFVKLKHKVRWISLEESEKKSEGNFATTDSAKNTDVRNTHSTHLGTEGITVKKSEIFSEWYTQVVVRAELIEYYDVSGCYIYRPYSFFMWEQVQAYMNKQLRAQGVDNCYFPIFVTKARLETEKAHVEGFTPEVAWVTRYGDSELKEPLAIRPTSETIVYPFFARWIRSHRDLPLKINQWCQIVRWEFKQPTPFIRSREFLWQEGHTAHATKEEAYDFMLEMLDLFHATYEDIFAVPTIKGLKSSNEKFAGADTTSTIETFIPENGRAIQAATSHFLGTNFSKMFKVEFETKERSKQFVHQTSWGITTRSIGVAVMLHGDDKGMVMPPYAAPIQVIFVPIIMKDTAAIADDIIRKCKQFVEELVKRDIRARCDDRDNNTAGWKFNDWEKKGVCIRVELGARDMKNKLCRVVCRDSGEKKDIAWDAAVNFIEKELEDMHKRMLEKAKAKLDSSIIKATTWEETQTAIMNHKLAFVPWSEEEGSEDLIKKAMTEGEADDPAAALSSSAKFICCPLEQPEMPSNTKCFFTKNQAKRWWLFGRSY